MFHHDALHTFVIITASFAVLTGLSRIIWRLVRRDRDGLRKDVLLLIGVFLILVGNILMRGPYDILGALSVMTGAILLLFYSILGSRSTRSRE